MAMKAANGSGVGRLRLSVGCACDSRVLSAVEDPVATSHVLCSGGRLLSRSATLVVNIGEQLIAD